MVNTNLSVWKAARSRPAGRTLGDASLDGCRTQPGEASAPQRRGRTETQFTTVIEGAARRQRPSRPSSRSARAIRFAPLARPPPQSLRDRAGERGDRTVTHELGEQGEFVLLARDALGAPSRGEDLASQSFLHGRRSLGDDSRDASDAATRRRGEVCQIVTKS